MQKKILISITIISLVLGMVLPVQAYGSSDIGSEARICKDLGILKGDIGVVDSAYLETHPSRLQAAIMFLRLKGLEQEALRYAGGRNFKDAGTIAWKEGRNVLSYLKDHPELGWIGDGVNFLPYNLIDSKAYYKVLLESLGYKQKIDGNGDFDWNSVLEFAEGKGLKKVAAIKNFTVESLAIATVEALKTRIKNDDRKLIEYLVDIGDVDKEDARDLDLYSEEIKAEVKTVRAISNSKVEVVFEEPVNSTDAVDDDLYTIKQLEIKGISIKNDSAIIIDTSAMNESTTYTLEFDDKSYSFKGLKKDSNAPRLITAECKDTDLVELTFDRVLDNETAQDTGIYTIEGVTVKSARLDSTNTKVRLTTSGIQSSRSYELKIRGIKNGDGVTTKSITKKFTGRKDTTAPKLNKLTVLNNIRLLLEFSDSNGLDKAIAQKTDNYRITSKNGGLDVESVEVKDSDDDGLWDTVEIVTESQDSGEAYTLIIEEIADASVMRNKTARETKREFRGKSKDKAAPTVARNPKVVTDTMVEIEFSDSNALDLESARDLNSYDIDGLEIEDIRIKDPDNLYSSKGRTVLLITSEMEKNESYTLSISGIMDEFGNEMKEKSYRFKGIADDRTPPYIISVECIDSKTIELNFDNVLDEKSAENITNYRIDSLAIATKAVLQENERTVRLTVSSLASDKNHTILLNNIKDISGNTLSNVSVSILYNGSLNDNDPPEVEDIDAVNEYEIWVHFEEEVYAEKAEMKATGITFKQAGYVLDDGTTVVMTTTTPMQDKEYEVTSLTGIRDIRGNEYRLESGLDFYGTENENEAPEVDDWDQLDIRRFRVVFSEPVLPINGHEVSGIKNPSGVNIDWKAVLNPDKEDTEEAYSTVDYIAENREIPADKDFYFNFTAMVSDYVGRGAFDDEDDRYGDSGYTELESYLEDDEEPYLEYVEAITQTRAQVVFSEEMSSAGSYKITYEDENGREKTIDIITVGVDSKDKTRVNIFTEDKMTDEYWYILKPTSAAADLAGNRLDIRDLEEEFEGTNIMGSDYIQGVELLSANTLKVTKSTNIFKVSSLYELDEDGDQLGENLIDGTPVLIKDNVYKVASKKALLRNIRYKITVDGLEYRFNGGVQDGGLELKLPEREIRYDYLDLDKHRVEVFRANGERLDVDEAAGCFKIDGSETLKNGETLYIYVIRESDDVVMYGIRIKAEGVPVASSSKEITSFSLKSLDPDVIGTIEADNIIRLTVPYGTDTDSLAASFSCSDNAVVKVGSVTQVSGQTRNDFGDEVTYTVIAQDGSKKSYLVRVTKEESKYEKKITGFTFKDMSPEVTGEIDNTNHTITLVFPSGTDLTSLKPIIEVSEEATVHPESGEARDFREPVAYKVTAKDGSSQSYIVEASVSKSSENYVETFKFDGVDAYDTVITAGKANTIRTKVPYGTNLSKLVPVITVSEHAKVTPESGKVNDFTNEAAYTVTAEDGTDRVYIVKVTAALNTEKQMKEFGFTNPKAAGLIDEAAKTISIKVPYGTALNGLTAVFASSPDSKVFVGSDEQKSGENAKDFTEKVIYTVAAQDGSKQNYTVTVTTAADSEKYLSEFAFNTLKPEVKGIIDEQNHTVKLTVPKATELNTLAAYFQYFGRTVEAKEVEGPDWIPQTSGITNNDFSKNIIYRITAHDGTTAEYTVIVTVSEGVE